MANTATYNPVKMVSTIETLFEIIEYLKTIGESEVIDAISVFGTSQRLTGDWFEEDLSLLLLGTANELKHNVVHS